MSLTRLETYTMISLLSFGHFLVLVLLLAYRGRRSRSRALNYFMVARVLQGIGWSFILFRGQWPDLLTVHGGNIALIFGVAAESIAFITYRRRSSRVEQVFLGMAVSGAIVFALFARTPTLIVAVGATVALFFNIPTAVILLKRSRERMLLRFVGILFAIVSVSFLFRAVHGFRGFLDFTVSHSLLQSAFYLPVFSVLLGGGIAMVLLLKEEDERALRESHEKYDVLFRSTPSAVFLSEPDSGIVVEANPQCLDLTGYTPEEIRGRTFTELGLWLPGERERAEEIYRADGRLVNHEIRARRRDGQERAWIVSSGAAQLRDCVLLASSIQDITARKTLETRVHGLLAEKELLLREVHHRVRNNLSQIISLLSLQKQHLQGQNQARVSDAHATGPAGVEAALDSTVNRIRGMLALYDQIYTEADYSSVPIRGFLTLLVERLRAAFPALEHVTVTLDIENIDLSPQTVSPLGQLVNELFTNSMKHAFQGRSEGAIRVVLHRTKTTEETAIVLEYEDDGPGMQSPAEHGESPARDRNRSESTDQGFGTILIEALAEQLGATWSIDGPPGARYRFCFNPDP